MNIQKSFWLSTLVLATLFGCSSNSGFPKTYKVSGTVKQGGRPVEGALVTFVPAQGNKSAVGSTNASGEYKLSTFGPSDGALPGAYKISITKTTVVAPSPSALPQGVIASGEISDSYAPPTTSDSGAKVANKNSLPVKYASEQTSGLIATVGESDKNVFDFEL